VAVAVYYYFRIVKSMFIGELSDQGALTTSFGLRVALAVTGFMTLAVGIFPEPFLRLVQFK
jgi:NADH:ubiquinone oxidoreductase subunit 2 (subunit N)